MCSKFKLNDSIIPSDLTEQETGDRVIRLIDDGATVRKDGAHLCIQTGTRVLIGLD